MRYKLKNFAACLLCLFQCIILFSSDALAATSEGGSISSSFSYEKYEITVKDKYYDNYWNFEREDIRETKTYTGGESYSYNALEPLPDGYILDSDDNISGVATEDEEIEFNYIRIRDAYVTVSFDEELCNYLNKYGVNVSPTDIVDREEVYLGEESNFYISFNDIDCITEVFKYASPINNISSLRTYYYEYGKGWNHNASYLGYPIDGLREDENIRVETDAENSSIPVQSKTSFECIANFPKDTGVDRDRMSCCHIVISMDCINNYRSKSVRGVYRTVIDDIDAENDIESWYGYTDNEGFYAKVTDGNNWIKEDIKNNPDAYTFIERGTRISLWQKNTNDDCIIYFGKDKVTNKDIICFKDGSEFILDKAPLINGYKCINPNSPREFICRTDSELSATCYYYDYIPVVTHEIIIKDKFIDESGVEEKTDIRQIDYIPENDSYEYEALEPIPDGYKLISNPTVTDTSTEDKEIVFIYQKLHKYTITVKDKYVNESGVEEKTDIRQENELYEDCEYHYSALSPVPEGYELVGASDYAGKVGKDIEIIFTYRKKIVVPDTFTVVVKDKYIDIDGSVLKIDERIHTALKLNDEYNFQALNPVPEGYVVVGTSTYTGRVTTDMDIMFVYQKKPAEKPATYIFKVVDEYYDVDGNVIKTVERTTDTLEDGSEYVCTALSPVPDGYVLISDKEYRGIISEDTVIVFKYKDASVRLVTVKGYMTYKNGEPVANKKIEIHSTVRSATTDANGYYEIRNIETGNHKYIVYNDDGTDLITCDLNITKSGQDIAIVTYKMEDTDVSIDMSVVDVLQIDAVLPLYKLEVFDKYYNEDNQLVKSELRESLLAVKAGTAYSYDAFSPEGYTVTSKKKYSGIVTNDTTIIFIYKKDKKPDDKPTPKPDPTPSPKPDPKTYRVTVVDNYYDANAMLISSSVRLTEIKSEGDAYYYEAKVIPNFTLIGVNHYSSFVYSDITLAFAYKVVSQPKDVVITVIDRYVDEGGSTEDKIRLTENKKAGESYYYEAVPSDGYQISGSFSYSGVATSSFALVFTYQKEGENDGDITEYKEYTVTVIDKFITDIPVNNFIIDESEQTGISDGLSNFNTYHYTRENGKYIYMVRREVRCRDIYTENSLYQYDARELKNFACIGETQYSGVVTGDVELEFVYARIGLTARDIPNNVYTSKPDYPDAPEAKTGDLDEVNRFPYVIVVILLTGVIAAALAGRKRYYR